MLGRSSTRYKPVKEYSDDDVSSRTSQSEELHVYQINDKYKTDMTVAKSIFAACLILLGYLAGWFTHDRIQYRLASSGNASQAGLSSIGVPQFPVVPSGITSISVKKVFKNNHTFDVDREDRESQDAWHAYNSRFVSFDDDTVQDSGLLPSTRAGGRQVYSVAAYHQLHCVHVIRYGWGKLKSKGPGVLDEPYPGLEALTEGYSIEGHVSHCLDMIRQALECHADPTLEPMMEDDGETLGGHLASGWGGTPHTCRDFAALTDWIDAPEQFPVPSVEVFTESAVSHSHSHSGHHHEN